MDQNCAVLSPLFYKIGYLIKVGKYLDTLVVLKPHMEVLEILRVETIGLFWDIQDVGNFELLQKSFVVSVYYVAQVEPLLDLGDGLVEWYVELELDFLSG